MNDDRHLPTEKAVNALQEATLLTGHLRTTRLADLDDLTKLKAALERAITALRRKEGTNGQGF